MNATALSIPFNRNHTRTLVLERRLPQDHSIDARMLTILDAPLVSRETPGEGFARKERDLGNAFAQLSIEDAGAMLQRLSINYAGDPLARKFAKLAEERRERLLDFLDLLADPVLRTSLFDDTL